MSKDYRLCVYENHSILFDRKEMNNFFLLNQIELDLLQAANGKRNRGEICHYLCQMYSISEHEGKDEESSLIEKYLDHFIRAGVLVNY